MPPSSTLMMETAVNKDNGVFELLRRRVDIMRLMSNTDAIESASYAFSGGWRFAKKDKPTFDAIEEEYQAALQDEIKYIDELLSDKMSPRFATKRALRSS